MVSDISDLSDISDIYQNIPEYENAVSGQLPTTAPVADLYSSISKEEKEVDQPGNKPKKIAKIMGQTFSAEKRGVLWHPSTIRAQVGDGSGPNNSVGARKPMTP